MKADDGVEPSRAGDVQIIRDILFGEQARLFQEQIEALREENRQLRAALQAEASAREQADKAGLEKLGGAEGQIRQRAGTLEEMLQAQIEAEAEERSRAVEEILARLQQAQKEIATEFAAVRQGQRAALKQQADLALSLAASLSLAQEQDAAPAEDLADNG